MSAGGSRSKSATATAPAKLCVLAAGINAYAEERLALAFAVPDAQAVGRALAQAGKGPFSDVDVQVLRMPA